MKDILLIVPTKNSWIYLTKLVKSLKNQTDKNFRVIFIDAYSSQKHENFLRKLKESDSRFLYKRQKNIAEGIYGAMNDGFTYAKENEWILFWGSDDYAYSRNAIYLMRKILNKKTKKENVEMIIFKGNFVDIKTNLNLSPNHFSKIKNKIINKLEYRKMLFHGFRQAHQATLINPHSKKLNYESKFSLAADLYFYLQSTKLKESKIILSNKTVVNIGAGGISRRRHFRRIFEVVNIYWKEFNFLFFIPFLKRYCKFI